MSEQDRMDRARRIRQMRQGRRAGADGPEAVESENESSPDEQADHDSTNTEAVDDESEDPETGDDESKDPGTSDPVAHVDDAVAAAVERVSGATASVPSPEELNEGTADPDQGSGQEESDTATDGRSDVGAEADPGAEADADIEDDAGAETDDAEDAVGVTARAGVGAAQARSEPETRVLEFTLDDEQYCLDIEYIEEIVKRDGITRVPNTPEFVEGVVDLRGQITTILNPKVVIETDDQTRGDLLVVFDSEAVDEQGHLGWVVDAVRQVSPVSEDEVNDSPVEGDHIQGVIDRGDDEAFVVWTTPDLALDEAT